MKYLITVSISFATSVCSSMSPPFRNWMNSNQSLKISPVLQSSTVVQGVNGESTMIWKMHFFKARGIALVSHWNAVRLLVDMATQKRWQPTGQTNYEWRNASHSSSTPSIAIELFWMKFVCLFHSLIQTFLKWPWYVNRYNVPEAKYSPLNADTAGKIEWNPPDTYSTSYL